MRGENLALTQRAKSPTAKEMRPRTLLWEKTMAALVSCVELVGRLLGIQIIIFSKILCYTFLSVIGAKRHVSWCLSWCSRPA